MQGGCLNLKETLAYAANHLDFMLLNLVAQHFIFDEYDWYLLIETAIRKRSMRLLRFVMRMGAIPNHNHCNMAIQYNHRYMFLWLTRRVRHVKELYLVLAYLREKNGFRRKRNSLMFYSAA